MVLLALTKIVVPVVPPVAIVLLVNADTRALYRVPCVVEGAHHILDTLYYTCAR